MKTTPQLRETVRILRGMLREERPFTYQGEHYSVRGAVNLPPPEHRMRVEVGGAGDRLLGMVAEEADGWNCPAAALPTVNERVGFLREACDRAGRSISDLRMTVQIACAVGDQETEHDPMLATFAPQHGLVGPADAAARRLKALMELGFTGFYCIVPPGPRGRACFERLVTEVRPVVAA